MLLRDIWCLLNLSQFDPIKRMIPLTVIQFSGFHCVWNNVVNLKMNKFERLLGKFLKINEKSLVDFYT